MRDVSPLLIQPFRLLFIGAALFASVEMTAWSIFLHLGLISSTVLPPILWHGHEMLFGFASALVGGFLLTAVANWTGLPTTTPLRLVCLVAIWLAARIAFLIPQIPYAVVASLDCLYFPALAALVAIPILRKRDYKHIFIVVLLLVLAVLDLLFHLSVAGRIGTPATKILEWVVDFLVVMMVIVGGRIIPFFTERRIEGIKIARRAWVDRTMDMGSMVLALLDLALPNSRYFGIGSLVLAALIIVRMYGWQPWNVWREPMLWVLHAGYLWIAVGLSLRGIAALSQAISDITALHAITAGALGSLAIGMMTRVPLGHTGRALIADKAMTTAFVLVNVAAVLRVCAPTLLPVAGLLWASAFGIYFVRFIPIHAGVLRAN